MIRRGSINVFAWHEALRTAIVCLAALVLWHYGHSPEGYWLVLSAVFLLQIPATGRGFHQSIFLLLCGAGLLGNVFLVQLSAASSLGLPLYLFLTTLMSGYFGLQYPRFFPALFFMNVAGILAAGLLTTHEYLRMESIAFGVGLVLIARFILWPVTIKQQIRHLERVFLQNADEMQRKFFAIYVARDYEKKHYQYERELHRSRCQLFAILKNIRELQQNIARHLEEVFSRILDLLIALGSLRYRVRDSSTLELCENELKGLSQALSQTFKDISSENLAALLAHINAMEAVYYRVLQTAAKEAEVFLIFIKQLYSLYDELELIAREKADVK